MRSFLTSAKTVFASLASFLVYTIGMSFIFFHLGDFNYFLQFKLTTNFLWINFINMVILAPLWEEAVFRYAPMEIAKGIPSRFTIPIIILSSFVFAWLHGAAMFSIIHQGIFGLVQCFIYLKRGYWTCVANHAVWNFFCLMFLM